MKTQIFNFIGTLRARNSLLYSLGLMHLILFFLFLLMSFVDHRTVLGINTWIKPMKFAISICIYLWTFGWIMVYLPVQMRLLKFISIGISITMILEMACIMYQAARGVPSHFNFTTNFDAAIFGIMGLMIAANSIFILVVFFLFLIKKPKINPNYLLAIRLSLLVFIIGNIIGGMMIQNGAHSIGTVDGSTGIFFLNWNLEGGDLRVSHLLGLHALQIIPLFSYYLEKKTNFSPKNQFYLLLIFFLIYAMLFSGSYFQALAGTPII